MRPLLSLHGHIHESARREEDRPDPVCQPGQRGGLGCGPRVPDRRQRRRCGALVPGGGLNVTDSGPTALEEALRIRQAAADKGITIRMAQRSGGPVPDARVPAAGRQRPGSRPRDPVKRPQALDTVPDRARICRDKTFNSLYGHSSSTSSRRRPAGLWTSWWTGCICATPWSSRTGSARMPVTLDLTDLLLTKLQIVELNEKDAQDVVYLCSAYAVREGDEPGTIGLGRIRSLVGNDWGWWRTVTMNLERITALASGDGQGLLLAAGRMTPSSNSACSARPPRPLPRACAGKPGRRWASGSAGTRSPRRPRTTRTGPGEPDGGRSRYQQWMVSSAGARLPSR